MQTCTSNSGPRAPQAVMSSASAKNKMSRAGAGTGQKSTRGKKAQNQPSNTDLPSIGDFQFTEASLATFKAYQQRVEEEKQAAAAAQDEGRFFFNFCYLCDPYFFF